MRVLFDTNILLDVLLEREPHVDIATRLVALVDNGHVEGSICATAVTTLYYVGAKDLGRKRPHDQVRTLLAVFEVAPVGRDVLQRALDDDGFNDFEDAVAHEAAHAAGMSAIVTRNGRDFAKATIPVFEPHELLAAIVARSD
ncbi:MAG: PIN domain-containing protein [Coriobacteriia bacterium]|nr:PIN domain-containing protein [Coriobacteriia bacterium]